MVYGDVSVEVPEFVPLTALYVGQFASTNHAELLLWSGAALRPARGEPKRLVLAAVQDEGKPQPAKTLQRAMRSSPFFAPSPDEGQRPPFRGVMTFEISLHDIVGLDYLNPLIVDASRLAVEATKITRRWFPSLQRCSEHYGWSAVAAAGALAAGAAGSVASVTAAPLAAGPQGGKRDDGSAAPSSSSSAGSAAAERASSSTSRSRPPALQLSSSHDALAVQTRSEAESPIEQSQRTVSRLVSELYRPQPHGEDADRDGRRPALRRVCSRVVPHTERCRAPSSPSKRRSAPAYWQEGYEELRYQKINNAALYVERVVRWFDKDRTACSGSSGDGVEDTVDYTEVIRPQTINFRFDDPFLPYVLREVIHDPDFPELLRLYEAGLPAWTIYMPMYTGLYRRWMRLVVSCITVLISCITMFLGFYDLYQRIPAVRTLLNQVLGPLSSTLEELVVVRFSVVLAWILPYNVIFQRGWHIVRWLAEGCRWLFCSSLWLVSATVAVVNSIVGPTISSLWFTITVLFQPVAIAFSAATTACDSVLQALFAVFGACRGALWGITRCVGALFGARAQVGVVQQTTSALLKNELTSVRQACMSIYNGTIFVSVKIAKHQASIRLAFHRWHVQLYERLCRRIRRHPYALSCAVCVVVVTAATRATHGSFGVAILQVFPEEFAAASPQKWLSDMCYGSANEVAQSMAWEATLLSMLCKRMGPLLADEPVITQVSLLCGTEELVCWERRSNGGRRCHCPYHRVRGLNVTSDRLGSWALQADGPQSSVVSITCSGGTWCYIGGPTVQRLLQGESSAELMLMGAWRPMLGDGPDTSMAADAAFVVEMPRLRAAGPGDVHLCLDGGATQDSDPWSKVLPLCGAVPATCDVGETETNDGNATWAGGAPPWSKAGAESQARGAGRSVHASWTSGSLGSCDFVAYEVIVHVRHGAAGKTTPRVLCTSRRHHMTSCSAGSISLELGDLSVGATGDPSASASPAKEGSTSQLTKFRLPGSTSGAFAAVRAQVRMRCTDVFDAPHEPSYSPVYVPSRSGSVRSEPMKLGASLFSAWAPTLLTWEAQRLAWRWTVAWARKAIRVPRAHIT